MTLFSVIQCHFGFVLREKMCTFDQLFVGISKKVFGVNHPKKKKNMSRNFMYLIAGKKERKKQHMDSGKMGMLVEGYV